MTGEEEEIGLDLTQHGERGYIMGIGELMGGVHEQEPFESAMAERGPPIAARETGCRLTRLIGHAI